MKLTRVVKFFSVFSTEIYKNKERGFNWKKEKLLNDFSVLLLKKISNHLQPHLIIYHFNFSAHARKFLWGIFCRGVKENFDGDLSAEIVRLEI